ncbi:MAG: hypothetical protein KDE31_32905, partial [Caldilineaceae bacterium]|nr:hypothetical protein [Caldilineaceae bacterium]
MQRQTHRLLMMFCFLVLVLLFAACGGGTAPTAEDAAPAAASGGNEAAPPAEPTAEEVVAIEASAAEETTLAGEIVISVQSNDTQSYQALADAYMEQHPEVNVLVELKSPGTGPDAYLQWVRTQFASEVPRVSIIESVHLRDLAQEGR